MALYGIFENTSKIVENVVWQPTLITSFYWDLNYRNKTNNCTFHHSNCNKEEKWSDDEFFLFDKNAWKMIHKCGQSIFFPEINLSIWIWDLGPILPTHVAAKVGWHSAINFTYSIYSRIRWPAYKPTPCSGRTKKV